MKVPGGSAVLRGLLGVMDVGPRAALAGQRIAAEELLELAEQVGLGPEVAEVAVARGLGLLHLLAHLGAVVAVEGIALDDRGVDQLAPEDPLEGRLDRARARAGGTGHGDDGMSRRHLLDSGLRRW